MFFNPGEPQGENLEELPEYFVEEKMETAAPSAEAISLPPANAATTPIENFAYSAIATGHSNLKPDQDGVIRRIAPLMQYGDQIYPSFGVQLIREYKNLPRESLTWKSERKIALRSFTIPLDATGMSYLEFAGPAGTFDRYSAFAKLLGVECAQVTGK